MAAPNNNVNPSRVVDTQTGRQSKPWIDSAHFGRYRGPLVQTVSITREQTVELIPEFDNPNMAASVRTYNGSKASVEWVASQNQSIEAMIMDTNPLTTPLLFDPSQTHPINLLVTDTGRNSATKYSSRLLIQGLMDADGIAEDTKSAMKKTAGFNFLQDKEIINGQIQYTRFTNAATFVTADDVAFAGGVGTFPTQTVLVNNTDGTTTRVLYAQFNGTPVFDTTQYSATPTTFTPTTAPVSGDVWVVYTVVVAS